MNIDVAHWNATLGKKYPVTVEDKGWVYGVWYCGTVFTKAKLHGQYPPGYLKRVLALFPSVVDNEILHCPSGTVTGPGVTVDAASDGVRCPQIVASADVLPFDDDLFSLVISDPPYSKEDSAKYGFPPFPMGKFMRECRRILKDDGILAILHTRYPSYRRKEWKLVGLVAVVTGFMRATRILSLFQNLPAAPSPQPPQGEVDR